MTLSEILELDDAGYAIVEEGRDKLVATLEEGGYVEIVELVRLRYHYEITITMYNRDEDEIDSPEALAQHDIVDATEEEVEEEFSRQVTEWERAPALSIEFPCRVRIARSIAREKCYVNMPHTHFFRAHVIFATSDKQAVRDIFNCRDVLVALYESALKLAGFSEGEEFEEPDYDEGEREAMRIAMSGIPDMHYDDLRQAFDPDAEWDEDEP